MLYIIILIIIFLLYYSGVQTHSYWKKKGVSTLKPVPFLGNIAPNFFRRKSFAELLNNFYTKFPNQRVMGFYQYQQPTLLIRDLELIKKICVKDFNIFPAHLPFAPEDVDPLWGNSVFAITDKDKWRAMRTILSPMFTSSKLKNMFPLMTTCARQYSEFYQQQGKTVVIEFKDFFMRYANDAIATTLFGVSCNSLENPTNQLFTMGREATDFSGINGLRFFLMTISPSLMKALKIGIYNKKVSRFFKNLIRDMFKFRGKNNEYCSDLIHQFLELRRIRTFNKNGLNANDYDEITAQALIFYFAGVDSVSAVLTFVFYELAINPNIQTRLRAQVDDCIERCSGNLDYDSLMEMNYLDMVVTEALRKWPPTIATDRVSIAPYTLEPESPNDVQINLDIGSNIWIPIFAIHRDPKYYPNPEKFDPERFDENNKKNLNPLAYLPFGVGPRSCIGARFTIFECKIIIVEIISKFEILKVNETQMPLKLHKSNFPLLSENGVWLGLKPRN